jgi:hypothetical protein
MRTTLEIDDEVFRRAKQRAAERGRTLGEVVTQSLRETLSESAQQAGTAFVMPVFGKAGQIVERSTEALANLRDEGR